MTGRLCNHQLAQPESFIFLCHLTNHSTHDNGMFLLFEIQMIEVT